MKRLRVPLILFAIFAMPVLGFAKGRTVKIVITGEHFATPIESTDKALGQFGVWEGPGVVIGGVSQSKGFIADWSRGFNTDRPNGLERYTVSFYEGCKFTDSSACHSEEPSLAYVVFYEYDSSSGQGYVYLPGRDDQWYELNVRSIYRKLEGNWFIASDGWQSFVLSLIQQAQRQGRF